MSLSKAIEADTQVFVEHLDDFEGFLQAHCIVEDTAHTPFYTLCSAYYLYLCANPTKRWYSRYNFPRHILKLVESYEQRNPQVRCSGFTQGVELETYNGLTVLNVRIVAFLDANAAAAEKNKMLARPPS